MSTRPQSPDPLTNFMLRLPGLNRTKAVKDFLQAKLDNIETQVNHATKVDTDCLKAIIDLTESVNTLSMLVDALHEANEEINSKISDLTRQVGNTRAGPLLSRIPTKKDALSSLRRNGLDAKTILDIGVQHGTPQLQEVFPDLKHFLFEPVEEYYSFIEENYKGYDYELVRAAISERDGENLLNIWRMGSDTITHSGLDGTSGDDLTESRVIKTMTLDSFLRDRNCPKPYLLKLDVDGHELPILLGAEETLKHTSCIVIESPLYYLSERVTYLESKGFLLWDIIDLCYYRDNLHQVDLIFLSNDEKLKPPFSPQQDSEFDWNQWKELSQLI